MHDYVEMVDEVNRKVHMKNRRVHINLYKRRSIKWNWGEGLSSVNSIGYECVD